MQTNNETSAAFGGPFSSASSVAAKWNFWMTNTDNANTANAATTVDDLGGLLGHNITMVLEEIVIWWKWWLLCAYLWLHRREVLFQQSLRRGTMRKGESGAAYDFV